MLDQAWASDCGWEFVGDAGSRTMRRISVALTFRGLRHLLFGGVVAGGVLLSGAKDTSLGVPWGALAIVGACACWALDNNPTRAVSGGDPVQIAAIKGGVAGVINIGIALALGSRFPEVPHISAAAVIGLAGYGISLVAFVLALRHLGAARTGAYFSSALFLGAALSLLRTAMIGRLGHGRL